ncbi:MAG: MGMT family protein [Campylobacterales bacterium]|nr:MGMT family protein [Campylobacterales bacterium]
MSSFRERCLEKLTLIPKGRVSTYKSIAHSLHSKAYRAVGSAIGKNPNPIIVPCHRVVNSDGSLGGYAKGKEKKIQLLQEEGVQVENDKIVDFENIFFDVT